jgi:hypothetical protein
VNLARLLRDTGRRDEALAMVADIYHWFTEGFDLPDLELAKALLDELNESRTCRAVVSCGGTPGGCSDQG